MNTQNDKFVAGIAASAERATRLHDMVSATDADTVTLDRNELWEVVSMHLLLCGYAMGAEATRAREKP